MMQHWVPDTSVVLKWVRREETLADHAQALLNAYLNGLARISVPTLLAYEFANVLRYKREIAPAQLGLAIQSLFDLDLAWIAPTDATVRRAAEIAHTYDTTVYDASFAALAEAVNAVFITADARLARRLDALPWVLLLGEGRAP